jgi:6-phosphogluconolactonase (cycloisomerase 2 family)
VTNWLVGAYGPEMDGTAAGITRLRSRADGSLEPVEAFLIEAPSPAFLARANGRLYAALEGEGQVLVDGERFSSGGGWPCHIGVYGDDVVVANYRDGRVALLTGQVVEPEPGSGPYPRQSVPRAHSTAQLAPGVIAKADLGADRIDILSLIDGVLAPRATVPLPSGTGPRDLLVSGSLLYILGEFGRNVTVAEWNNGSLELLGATPLPGAHDDDAAAALALGGGYLYAGLRGTNQVSVLSVAADGRSLDGVTSVSSAGNWPRHLVVDGGVLHVANQLSNGVASFAIGADGIPGLIAEPTPVASPTYLLRD